MTSEVRDRFTMKLKWSPAAGESLTSPSKRDTVLNTVWAVLFNWSLPCASELKWVLCVWMSECVCVCASVWLSGSFIGTLSKIKCPTVCVDLADRLGPSEDQPLLILSTGRPADTKQLHAESAQQHWPAEGRNTLRVRHTHTLACNELKFTQNMHSKIWVVYLCHPICSLMGHIDIQYSIVSYKAFIKCLYNVYNC